MALALLSSVPSSPVQPSESASADQPAKVEAPKDANTETPLAVGKAGTLGDWSVTVTKVQMKDSVSDNQYMSFKPEEGSKYLLVDVTITNNGKSAATFLPSI